jgi:hypothetical protein
MSPSQTAQVALSPQGNALGYQRHPAAATWGAEQLARTLGATTPPGPPIRISRGRT